MIRLNPLALIVLMTLAGTAFKYSHAGPDLTKMVGKEEVVFRDASRPCPGKVSPDAPYRIVRVDGLIYGFISYIENYLAEDDGQGKLKVHCNIVLKGNNRADSSAYDDFQWIASPWLNEKTGVVHALIHNEYHGHRHPGACIFQDYLSCWYNSIVYGHWKIGLKDFQSSGASHVVAVPQFDQERLQGRHRGFFNPTNIISKDEFRYFLAETTGGYTQRRGVCLFRQWHGDPPWLWRPFVNNGFGNPLDAQFGRNGQRDDRTCDPVAGLQGPVTGLVMSPDRANFLAVFVGAKPGKADQSVVMVAHSSNLLQWKDQEVLSELPLMWSKDCGDQYRYSYPSLIDFDSPSPNFDTFDGDGFLYLTRFGVKGCRLDEARDLVRYRVRISF